MSALLRLTGSNCLGNALESLTRCPRQAVCKTHEMKELEFTIQNVKEKSLVWAIFLIPSGTIISYLGTCLERFFLFLFLILQAKTIIFLKILHICKKKRTFDLLPHKWGPLRKYVRVLPDIQNGGHFFAKPRGFSVLCR